MDAHRSTVAHAALAAAHDGSLDFPAIVGRLIAAGFEGYAVDFRRGVSTYYLPDGDSVDVPHPAPDDPVGAAFQAPAVVAAIREAQALVPGYTYAGFCRKVTAAGCAGYMVSFPGRRALYYGRTAETHVEHFPR
jgi:uncharacterized protein YbcV (DUF1398 family)